jgi:hypothetical protein
VTALTKRIVPPLLYVGLGAVLALTALLGWTYYRVENAPSEQEIKSSYIVDYTRTEQQRKGIDCLRLREELRGFLTGPFDKSLSTRGAGQDWKALLSQEEVARISNLREATFTCISLYRAGYGGAVNGLKDLGFAEAIERPLITLDILVAIGPAKKNCDSVCVDRMFQELREAQKAILAHVTPAGATK